MDPAPALIHSKRGYSPVPSVGLTVVSHGHGSGVSSILVQGGSRHHFWVDPCLTVGNQILLQGGGTN